MTQGIYKLEMAGQMYIGSSLHIELRFSQHKNCLQNSTHPNSQMQRLYDDGYHLTHEVLLECEEEDLTILEQASLDRHKPTLNGTLIARRPGLQDRASMSRAKRGTTVSPEVRAKIGAKARGKVLSPETRAKIGAASKGRTPSPEIRAKMSASHKGKKHSPETIAAIKAGIARRKARGSSRIRPNDGRDPV